MTTDQLRTLIATYIGDPDAHGTGTAFREDLERVTGRHMRKEILSRWLSGATSPGPMWTAVLELYQIKKSTSEQSGAQKLET